MLAFPPNFLWGTATAAHQVEGQNFNNDFWVWEQIPGHIKHNDSSRVANDWWNGRYLEDFDRAHALGLNAHRLSVEWSRIEPREGEVDPHALAFYRRVLEALHARGQTPMVTLIHFTLPRWVAAQGGWENPAMPQWLARYTDTVVRNLGDLCNLWITLNEPNGNAATGYVLGIAPPGKKNVATALKVLAQMVRGHAAIYYAIKRAQPASQVGMAYNIRPFVPHNSASARDRWVVRILDHLFNRAILACIEQGRLVLPIGRGQSLPEAHGTQDFIGLNHYYVETVAFDLRHYRQLFRRTVFMPETMRLLEHFSNVADINPNGLEWSLEHLNIGKPIYITENGIFDVGDDLQSKYLVTHLAAVYRAIHAGADVRGYFWWTLVDNFEWIEGYVPRFGLYHLDLATQTRTQRPVAAVYARIARENGIANELMEKYGHAF